MSQTCALHADTAEVGLTASITASMPRLDVFRKVSLGLG